MVQAKLTLAKTTVYPYLDSKDADKIKREIIGDKGLVSDNTTSSIRDQTFACYKDKHADKKLTAAEKDQLNDWNFLLDKSKDAIERHFDKRVSQLFTQAILCYGTDYQFREGHTFHQGLGSKNWGNMEFQAPHDATLPNLYAYSKSTKKEVAFGYASSFYLESNSADADIIRQVNDADRAIEEKTKTSLLRNKTVALLNKAAKGEIGPPEVVKRFLNAAIVEIDKAILKEDPKVIDVLRLYRQQAEDLIAYTNKPENIDYWVNLSMDNLLVFEPGITNQALIRQKINDLPIVIHKERHQKENESHIPCHFYDLYYHKVLSQFKNDELKIVEKALGINFEKLDKKVENFSYVKRTNALLGKHAGKINELRKEILPLMAEKQDEAAKKEHLALSSAKKVSLRPSLYKSRYKIIAADQSAQSTIRSLFESTLNKVKNASRASHFDDFFYHSLLKETQTDSDRLIFGKLLNVSPLALKQKFREVKVNKDAFAAISKYASNLSKLSDVIRENKLSKKDLETKIKDLVNQIVSSTKANGEHVRKLCYRRLFDHVDSPQEKILVENLIGSKQTLQQWVAANTKETSAERIIKRKNAEIKNTVQTALKEISDLNKKLAQYKNELFKELREANGMKQENFLAKYNELFPKAALNHHKLIDFEKGRSEISSELAAKIAKVYGISGTIFSPSHFAELT